ncbi:MAG TPA: nucleotidyltransferase family protein [Chryseosolibacter sp.]
MLSKEEIIEILNAHKEELHQKFPVKSLALFGSYARGDQQNGSDIDFLVEFSQPVGIEFIDLVLYLESILQTPVDLVTKNALKKALVPYVEKDLIYV